MQKNHGQSSGTNDNQNTCHTLLDDGTFCIFLQTSTFEHILQKHRNGTNSKIMMGRYIGEGTVGWSVVPEDRVSELPAAQVILISRGTNAVRPK